MPDDEMHPLRTRAGINRSLDALIIGAGFAGLYQLLCLRDRLGLSVKVLEAGGGVGGTWYWERYPGQPEIMRYLNFVAEKFDLKRDIQFDTRVVSAHYDEAANRWQVRTETGETYIAKFLITAVGCLSTANVPDIPGLKDFAGDWYHRNWRRRPQILDCRHTFTFASLYFASISPRNWRMASSVALSSVSTPSFPNSIVTN